MIRRQVGGNRESRGEVERWRGEQGKKSLGFWFGIQIARQPCAAAEIHMPSLSSWNRNQQRGARSTPPSAPCCRLRWKFLFSFLINSPPARTASQQVSCSNHLQLNISSPYQPTGGLFSAQQIHICTFSTEEQITPAATNDPMLGV